MGASADKQKAGTVKPHSGRVWTILILLTIAAIIFCLAKPVMKLTGVSLREKSDVKLTPIARLVELRGVRLHWNFGDTEFSGVLDTAADGRYEITLEQPEEIAGMRIGYDVNSGVGTVDFMGLSAELDPQKLGAAADVGKIWKQLSENRDVTIQENGVLTEITGTADGLNYCLIFDADGKPQQLSIPEKGIEYRFEWDTAS